MIKLQLVNRPVAIFDPNIKKHREMLSKFIQTQAWAHSPIRFVADDATEIDVNTMQRQMLEYYAAKEFGDKFAEKQLTAA